MESYVATIKSGEVVIVETVMVDIEKVRGGMSEWRGKFSLPERPDIGVDQRYRIELSDGRSGEILVSEIHRVYDSLRREMQVLFTGEGLLK